MFTLGVFLISIPLFYWILGEAIVQYEISVTDANSRLELGDDMGLAVLWGFVVLPGTLILAAVSTWVAWRWSRNAGSGNGSNA